MSWSRFGGEDTYTFPSVEGHLECCMCKLAVDEGPFKSWSVDEFIEHLAQHRAAGHYVADSTFEAVRAEAQGYLDEQTQPAKGETP